MHHTEYVSSIYIQHPPALTFSAAMADLEHHTLATRSSMNNLASEFSSLDMSPTAEQAYSDAIIASSHQHPPHHTRGESAPPSMNSISSHNDFLHLLARFHQAVRPLSSSSSPSGAFITDPSSQEGKVTHKRRTSGPKVRVTRRGSSPDGSRPKVTIPSVFADMNSLLRKAEEMIDFMRADVEDVMKKRRRQDRELRERGRVSDSDEVDMAIDGGKDIEESEPLIRKVPIAQRFSSRSHSPWYSPTSTTPEVQDHSMCTIISPTPRRIITPKRIRHRIANSDSALFSISSLNDAPPSSAHDIPNGFPTHIVAPDRPPHIPGWQQDYLISSPIQMTSPMPEIQPDTDTGPNRPYSPITIDDVSSRMTGLRLSTEIDTKAEGWNEPNNPGLSTSPTSTSTSASILSSPTSSSIPVPRLRTSRSRSNAVSVGSISSMNPIRMYAGYDHPVKTKSFSFSGGPSGSTNLIGTPTISGIAI